MGNWVEMSPLPLRMETARGREVNVKEEVADVPFFLGKRRLVKVVTVQVARARENENSRREDFL
jgi:hypothetical protein